MSTNPFINAYASLPQSLPIFPLPGAIVLPGAELPLNIFEPRYLNMIEDALGIAQKRLTRRGKPHAAGLPDKKRNAQRFLHPLDALGHGGLHAVQPFGGADHPAFAGDGAEHLEVAEFYIHHL